MRKNYNTKDKTHSKYINFGGFVSLEETSIRISEDLVNNNDGNLVSNKNKYYKSTC